MIDSYYRASYQKLCVEPLLPYIKRLDPHALTLGGCLLGIAAPLLIAFNFPCLGFFILMVSCFTDTLDGSLARYLNRSSPMGAVLDIVSDRIVEFAVILGLYFFDPASRGLPCIMMLGASLICVTSFLVVGIFSENDSVKSFHYSPGIIERTEAMLFFSFMILFPSFFSPAAYLFTVLTAMTALTRVKKFCSYRSI